MVDSTHTGRQILGISLEPSLARKVKEEAARRNLSLRKLFEEIWTLYEKNVKEHK
jgi:hypothetical protein